MMTSSSDIRLQLRVNQYKKVTWKYKILLKIIMMKIFSINQ